MAQPITLPRFLRLKIGGRFTMWEVVRDRNMALKGLWLYLNFLINHDATQKNFNVFKGHLFLKS